MERSHLENVKFTNYQEEKEGAIPYRITINYGTIKNCLPINEVEYPQYKYNIKTLTMGL